MDEKIKTVEQILSERGFSPVEKMLDLYGEIEEDVRETQDKFGELPATIKIDTQKLREKVLNSVMKCKQTEDGHRIKLLEMKQKNPDKDNEPTKGVILQHERRRLPDGRVVIEKVAIEQREAEGS